METKRFAYVIHFFGTVNLLPFGVIFFSLQKSQESFFWLEIVDFFPKARNVSSGVILNKLKLDSSVCENMNSQNCKRHSNKIFQYFFLFPLFSHFSPLFDILVMSVPVCVCVCFRGIPLKIPSRNN